MTAKPKKQNKYLYEIAIKGLYLGKWEILTYEETWQEARQTLRDYHTNQPKTPVKIVIVRELNPDYQEVTK